MVSEQPGFLICSTEVVVDRGKSFRFQVEWKGQRKPAFVLCYDGAYYAYLNVCSHLPMEMDWQAGEFWAVDQETILCAMHGATYLPDSGLCIRGPCKGLSLTALSLRQEGDLLYTDCPVFSDT